MTSEGSTPAGEEGSPPTAGAAPSGGAALARQLIERLTALETQFMDVQRESAELKIRIEKRPDEQKLPGRNAKTSSVDTRLTGKPDSYDGKDESWPSFSMAVRAYLAAIDPRLPELVKMAENPVEEVDNFSLSPEDERLSCQLYYIFTNVVQRKSAGQGFTGGGPGGLALVEVPHGRVRAEVQIEGYVPDAEDPRVHRGVRRHAFPGEVREGRQAVREDQRQDPGR